MTQTLEQMLSPGSNIFEQPIFSKVFEGMAHIIRDTSKNPGIERPASFELYQMLLSSLNGFVSFRNVVAEFKKRAKIPDHIPLAKNLSGYLSRQVFSGEPRLRDYLERYRGLKEGRVPDGIVSTYESFKSGYGANQA